MADCGDLLTNQDLSNAKKDATTMNDFVESNQDSIVSKNGKTIRTLEGINNDAQDAIDSFKLKSKGQYLPDPITLNDGFEYVVYLDKTYFAVSPPYTTDPVTYPTPDLDTVNLIEQSYLTRSFGEKIAGDGDSQLAGGDIWPLSSQESAQVGDIVSGAKIFRVGGDLYSSPQSASGVIESVSSSSVTISGTVYPLTLFNLYNIDTVVSYDDIQTAINSDNTGKTHVIINDRDGAKFRRSTFAEYDTYPDMARFTDYNGVFWIYPLDADINVQQLGVNSTDAANNDDIFSQLTAALNYISGVQPNDSRYTRNIDFPNMIIPVESSIIFDTTRMLNININSKIIYQGTSGGAIILVRDCLYIKMNGFGFITGSLVSGTIGLSLLRSFNVEVNSLRFEACTTACAWNTVNAITINGMYARTCDYGIDIIMGSNTTGNVINAPSIEDCSIAGIRVNNTSPFYGILTITNGYFEGNTVAIDLVNRSQTILDGNSISVLAGDIGIRYTQTASAATDRQVKILNTMFIIPDNTSIPLQTTESPIVSGVQFQFSDMVSVPFPSSECPLILLDYPYTNRIRFINDDYADSSGSGSTLTLPGWTLGTDSGQAVNIGVIPDTQRSINVSNSFAYTDVIKVKEDTCYSLSAQYRGTPGAQLRVWDAANQTISSLILQTDGNDYQATLYFNTGSNDEIKISLTQGEFSTVKLRNEWSGYFTNYSS